MKVLIMGLPGSGKTWLAEKLRERLSCPWFNADEVRAMANDWNFGETARLRQAARLANMANFELANGSKVVICDFVCPTKATRKLFNPDLTIWMNTIDKGRFEDTNKIFEAPNGVRQLTVMHDLTDYEIDDIARNIGLWATKT